MGPLLVLGTGHRLGANRARLNRIDAGARSRLLDRVHADPDRLDPAGFRWEGEVICAVAAKGNSART